MKTLDVTLVFRDVRMDAGGLGIDVRDLANGLAERGHRATVIASAADPGNDSYAGFSADVDVEILESPPPRRVAEAYGISPGVGRALRRRRPHVVHVFSCVPVYLHVAAMVAARRTRRASLVWTPMMHPLRRSLWKGYGARGVPMRLFDAVAPRAARYVDAVAAATRAEAAEFKRLGCPRVAVLPPAVHPARPVSDDAASAVRARLGLGDVPLVMAVAARSERRKGFGFALAAIEALCRRIPDVRFVVAGSGGVDLASSDAIVPVGRVSDEELAALYRAARVVFVPSSYEAFSRVVIEAWQQARPVVVTDRVGLAERVSGVGGTVVGFGDVQAAADSIATLLADPELARRLGNAGRELVDADYLVPHVVTRAERLYGALANG